MRILYAIQGTGNGHISRARDIIPSLMKNHVVDILISGIQADVDLPYTVKYRFKGLSFIFGESGGIDLVKTYRKSNLARLIGDIKSLKPDNYDLVINDFEPVSAWACFLNGYPCISLSHQAAVLNPNSPQPSDSDIVGKLILSNYAPASKNYGFHFKSYDTNIYTPVIRQQVRQALVSDQGHYTVYLPAYDDKRLVEVLGEIKGVQWEVFSKHNKKSFHTGNVQIRPISNESFIHSMASSHGILCGAGFETPAEALFMKKKLMVIPMKGQYEQQCNAAALQEMGIQVIKSLKPGNVGKIRDWIASDTVIEVDYPDITGEIIDKILTDHQRTRTEEPETEEKRTYSIKKIRKSLMKGIAGKSLLKSGDR